MRSFSMVLGLAASAAIVFAGTSARANMLVNGNFEDINVSAAPHTPEGVFTLPAGNTALAGWTVSGASVNLMPASHWQAASGNWSVDMTGAPGEGALSQVVTTTAGATYHLTFGLSANPDVASEYLLPKTLFVAAADQSGVVAQKTIQIYVGSRTDSDMKYVVGDLTFTALSSATAICFIAQPPPGNNGTTLLAGPVLDNADLEQVSTAPTAAVPEPASLSLLVLGGGLLAMRKRRK
jgi:choice-of-anchor C domain-containing protein